MISAWIASIIYGVNAITQKLTSKHLVSNPWMFNFFWGTFILIGTVPIALYYGAGMPAHWGSMILAGTFSFLTGLTYIFAMYRLDASIIGSIYNFRAVFTAALGATFLNELLTGNQYILIAIIVLAGICLNFDEHLKFKAFFRRRSLVGLLAVFVSAIFGFSIKWAVAENGFWGTSLWITIIAQVFLIGTIPLFYRELIVTPIKKHSWLAITGLVSALGDLAANKAFSINVSITSAIIAIPFSMILAYLFSTFAPALLEKHTHKVYAIRFAAAAVMLWAAIQLS
jgi:drug/metabolite transporter (DMT)-like permease